MPYRQRLKTFAKRLLHRDIPMIPQTHRFGFAGDPACHLRTFGEKNPGTVFYVIAHSPGSGFFSNMSYVLNHLRIAHVLGFTPVVDMENFPNLYNEQDPMGLPLPIRGMTNSWEYYFKPVSSHTLSEVYESRAVVFTNGAWSQSMSMAITLDTSTPSLRDIYRQYVNVNDDVAETVALEAQRCLAGHKVLGVHFRGQEMRTAPGHPFPPSVPQMLRKARAMIDAERFTRIFLVTEEQRYLDVFEREFGDMVRSTDAYRTYNINSYKRYPRPNHRYLLGRDVLVDALVLAQTDGILCGESNVSEFARFAGDMAPSANYVFKNGDNSANPFVAKYGGLWWIKRSLPRRLGGFSDVE